MKKCTKCGKEKSNAEFFVRDSVTKRLHSQCKECYREHRSTYYQAHYDKYKETYLLRAKLRRDKLKLEFRSKMTQYLNGKCCVICGETDIRVFEFDHLDPERKRFAISQAVKLGFGWDEVLLEMKRCRILCANCHKRRTAQQYNWYKA